jgi:hypothetical protein
MRTKYQNGLITAQRQTPANNQKTTKADGIFTNEFQAQLLNKTKWPKSTGDTITYSSPGSYSWVCPAGVTSVSLTGRGGSGSTASESYTTYSWETIASGSTYSGGDCFGSSVGSSLTKSFCDGVVSSAISTANNFPLFSNTNGSMPVAFLMYCTTTALYLRFISSISRTFRRTGTSSVSSNLASMPSSISGGWSFTPYASPPSNLQELSGSSSGQAGGSSSALGYTFSGASTGVVEPPAAINYPSVAVNPGQTYTIVVGTNYSTAYSFITIAY